MSDPLRALAGIVDQAWLVGGALRDRMLGRPTADYDVAVAVGDAGRSAEIERAARALGRAADGFPFALSEAFGAWRVVSRERSWQVDLTPLAGATIEADLALRDLTVNAIARPLKVDDVLVDPFGGLEDLRSRRLRRVCADAFERDPLRSLRLARLACELEFVVDPDTLGLARASAPRLREVAPERVFAELRRVLSAERAVDGLEVMDATAVTAAILPELVALRGVDQSRFHHLDAFDHTRAVLAETIALERDPEPVFGEDAGAVLKLLAEPLANELTRGQALRFGALLHDIAKPQTRAETPEGRVTFVHHDETGATVSAAILARLRASDRLSEYVAGLTRHHLRLGFLVHRMPLSRHDTYRYLHACAPVQVDVTVLSVADRLATRGDGAERGISRHLELARLLMREALAWRAQPPRPPIRGDQLSEALGIAPGPLLGELLHELEEASYAGEILTPEDAVQHARRRIERGG